MVPVRRLNTALAAVALVALSTPDAHAAPPPGACRDPEPARPPIRELPWAQQALDVTRAWPHSTGAGVLVAVVDTGVDRDHPQLSAPGKVARGEDFHLTGDLPGDFDCGSHGTAVASIVAADPVEGVGFHGVAPGARVLPVRVADRDLDESGAVRALDPVVLARGIWYAADQGAKVINLSMAGLEDNQYVRDAVAHAVAKDVLVVAAAGNRQRDGVRLPSFPAAYDGVLGVGAIDIAGDRMSGSQLGDYVDLVAPGKAVAGATRAGGHAYWEGTSFAAPFVAGTAALVRAAWPELTAPEVARRLLATASPARGEAAAYGAGVVNPYRAVTDGLVAAEPDVLPVVVKPVEDPGAARERAWWRAAVAHARRHLLLAAAVVLVAVVLLVVLVNGRRRRWTPTRLDPLPEGSPPAEVPDQVFLFPR
ncbi:type VII secretion-associated serine protease mycosin [Saccharothrix sp. S26]|uniref:type VII secretion-associated serine protease mycosin n=1 Tax=Saccharothrix sp. S26 TaxID=2907215 RepID=UPI001F338682|nr:type VII secretion-associated serine protease mycosin [Saccharothrix sp. S26]MCE6996009.1 type VII secretion-associated serine protease mycosin [Saccharothrix sp. S26]